MKYSIHAISEILEDIDRGDFDNLDLSGTPVADRDLRELVRQPGSARLKSVALRSTQIGGEGLKYLGHLHSIEHLGLGDTRVCDEDLKYLKGLHSLKSLSLEQTQIGDTGLRHLQKMRSLISLSLWETRVGNEGLSYLEGLRSLEELNLNTTQVSDDGLRHLRHLRSLRELRLLDANVTDAGLESLKELRSLVELELGYTQIRDDGLRHLANLHDLKSLSLGETQVGNLGLKHLQNLKQLKYLDISGCKLITDISPLESLLPSNGGALETLTGVPECFPEEVRRINKAAEIFNFLHSTKTDSTQLREVKLLVLGEGRTGKTHLTKWLTNQPRPWRRVAGADRTIGYAISTVDFEQNRSQRSGMRFRIFDFGGQPEQHGAHRLFMQSRRNIYAIVLKATLSAKQNRLLYWLRMVRQYAKDAPILLIVTHCENPARRKLKLQPLLDKLPPWFQPIRVVDGINNCSQQHGGHGAIMESLKALAANIQEIEHPFPNGLFTVKRWLEEEPLTTEDHHRLGKTVNAKLPQFKQLMTLRQFKRLCRACGAVGRQWKSVWLPLLRNIGVVHWVGDHPMVRETASPLRTHLFNPHWLCRPVYDIVGNPGYAKTHGLMPKLAVIGHLTGEETTRKTATLVRDLMLRTELIFPVYHKVHGSKVLTHYLVPDLIPSSPAVLKPSLDSTCIAILHYGRFLPDSVLLRFIGRHPSRVVVPFVENAYRNKVWIASEEGKCEALLEADAFKRTITVRVGYGDPRESSGYAFRQWIVHEFLRYPKPKRIELIPEQVSPDDAAPRAIGNMWETITKEQRGVALTIMKLLAVKPVEMKSLRTALKEKGVIRSASHIYKIVAAMEDADLVGRRRRICSLTPKGADVLTQYENESPPKQL
jgi:GTPase SAR1 family protein